MQIRNKKLKLLNIASFSDASFSNPDPMVIGWEKFSNLGDYIIMTNPGVKKHSDRLK